MSRYLADKKTGFTIVEITLSMAFVGTLLVVIAVITMQIMSIYNKGLTLKEVNSVSRMVVRDMQQSISGVNAFTTSYIDPSGNPAIASSLEDASDKMQHYYQNETGGRLCTGAYSYAWNYASALSDVGRNDDIPSSGLQYIQDGSSQEPVRFVRVFDTGYALCKDNEENDGGMLPDMSPAKYLNVFGEGNNNLALYTFEITTPLGSPVTVAYNSETGQDEATRNNISAMSTFYNLKFTLGTQMGDEQISGVNSSCKAPANSEYNNSEYCAINVIEFVARTGQL